MKRRAMSVLLAFVLALTLVPSAVWATTDGEQTTVDLVTGKTDGGDTCVEVKTVDELTNALGSEAGASLIKLGDNITLNTERVEVKHDVTIDFNGKTITAAGDWMNSARRAIDVDKGKLVFMDSTTDKAGKFVSDYGGVKLWGDNTEFELNDITIECKNSYAVLGGYTVSKNATVVMNSGKILGSAFSLNDVAYDSGSSVTINGGTIDVSNSSAFAGIYAGNCYKLTINGGTFICDGNPALINIGSYNPYDGEWAVNVNGGTFTNSGEWPYDSFSGIISVSTKGALKLMGGTFNVDPSANLAAGYTATKTDSTWTVSKTTETTGAATVSATTETKGGNTTTTITTITAKEDTTTTTTTNTIDVSKNDSITLNEKGQTAEVVVSKKALGTVVNNNATKPVEFKVAANTSVTFNKEAVKSIAEKMSSATGTTDATNVTLVVTPDATVSGNEKNALDSVKNSYAQTVELKLIDDNNNNLFKDTYGAKATVTVPFNMPAGNNTVKVYYLNATNGTAEYVGTAAVGSGTATFTVSHFSSYVLVPTTVSTGRHYSAVLADKAAETTTTAKSSPKTFDAGVGIYAASAILSVTGMAWVGKKKF